jgi:isocitrate/isopropylmalate dehydrogenase
MKMRILILPGDGIGPEVTREAVRVLQRVGVLFGHEFVFDERAVGGAAIEPTFARRSASMRSATARRSARRWSLELMC